MIFRRQWQVQATDERETITFAVLVPVSATIDDALKTARAVLPEITKPRLGFAPMSITPLGRVALADAEVDGILAEVGATVVAQ